MKPAEAMDKMKGESIAIIGDIMLDRFVWGSVSRISPEAPVPIVEIERESFHLGGAANVARNLTSLGAKPLLLGVVGDDEAARAVRQAVERLGLEPRSILSDASRPTTVKTRIIAGSQQVVRTDWESRDDLDAPMEERALDALENIVRSARAVVLSDYAKGTLTPSVIERAIELATTHGVPILVDPKVQHYKLYRDVTLLTPNTIEAERFARIAVRDESDIEEAARIILRELDARAVLITRGEQGMSLFVKDRDPLHIPTFAREVFDVSGAGDTVIATSALALGAGATLEQAAELANRAAGIVVGKLGTATVEPHEWIDAVG